MNYSKIKKTLIKEIKEQGSRYKMNGRQWILVNPNELGIESSLMVIFFTFAELEIEELQKIKNEKLTKITDTENYQITKEIKWRNIIQWIVNYENEEHFSYYSFWLAEYEQIRKRNFK